MQGKKVIIIVLLFLLLMPKPGQAYQQISAESAVIIEYSTGDILYDKQAHTKQSIASLTKVMTAIIAIEYGDLDEIVQASRRAIHTPGSSIYLEQGEEMSLEDLVYGLMLRSGNDAAVAIAEHIGGSIEGFVYLMNEKARWIGMTNTSFKNPHGLDEEDHYSTAYDVAILLRYAMSHPIFQEISGTELHQATTRPYPWQNKNKLLTQLYPYCTGGKTGYTRKAGRTLATTSYKNKMHLIAVTLNAATDWQDHISLYEWAYDRYDLTSLSDAKYKTYQLNEKKPNIIEKPVKEFRDLSMDRKHQFLKEDPILDDHVMKNPLVVEETTMYLKDDLLHRAPFSRSGDIGKSNLTKNIAYVFQHILKREDFK